MTWRPESEDAVKVEQYENATIYLGDCREIFQEIPEVQAVVTDPPYGVHYVTKRRKIMERPGAIENDEEAPLWCVPLIAEKVEDGGVVYICTQFSVFAEWQTGQFMEYFTPASWRTSNAETRRAYEPLHSKQHRPRRDRSRPVHGIGDNGGRGPATGAAVYRGRNLREVFRHSSAADRGRRKSNIYICGGVLLIYAIDFDGTLCVDRYPEIGELREDMIRAVLYAQRAGDRFILWTCRVGERLEEAVNWSAAQGLIFDAVNDNLPDMIALYENNCRKVFADGYIDDRNVRDLLGVEI